VSGREAVENILARMVDWINAYALWLYLAGTLALLVCIRDMLAARRAKKRTIFKLEREVAAARESRALSLAFLFVGIIVAITAVKFYLAPSFAALPPTVTPTATLFVFEEPPTRTVVSTPTLPTPTPTWRRPILAPTPTPPATSTPVPVKCPSPGVCIRYPVDGMRVAGVVEIKGTATMDRFQFYKVEYGLGENPQRWHSISEIRRQPVTDGLLDTWNITGFPPGVYILRLTVVDITGNFAPPHEIRVIIGQ